MGCIKCMIWNKGNFSRRWIMHQAMPAWWSLPPGPPCGDSATPTPPTTMTTKAIAGGSPTRSRSAAAAAFAATPGTTTRGCTRSGAPLQTASSSASTGPARTLKSSSTSRPTTTGTLSSSYVQTTTPNRIPNSLALMRKWNRISSILKIFSSCLLSSTANCWKSFPTSKISLWSLPTLATTTSG